MESAEAMLPSLERTLVMVKDLKDQPQSEFVLITNPGVRPQYYAVDNYEVLADNGVVFKLDKKVVILLRKDAVWTLVSRDVTFLSTERQLSEFSKQDGEATAEFMRVLDPEAWRAAEAELAKQGIRLGSGGTPSEPKPVPGQYL